MSVSTYRSNVNRINAQIADLLKKQAAEKKKDVDLSSKISGLSKRLVSSKSVSSIQSYQRQIDSKSKEQVRIQTKIADFEKKIADKRKELSRNQDSLTKALESETKNKQNQELNFLREKERINRSEVENIKRFNSEVEKQQQIFKEFNISEDEFINSDNDYELDELSELHKRIDLVLEKLTQLGYGQEILFEEIEQLKSKSKKISKKDLGLMLIGQLVSFGAGKVDNELAAEIFQNITNISLTRLIE